MKSLQSVLMIGILALAALLAMLAILALLQPQPVVEAEPTAIILPTKTPLPEPTDVSTKTPPEPTPRPPVDDTPPIATVNDHVVTELTWNKATQLDAVMSGLAGQSVPSAEETLDRLVNEILVLDAVEALPSFDPADVESKLSTLMTNWQVSDDALIQSLNQAGLTRSDLDERLERLLQVEAAYIQLQAEQSDFKNWLVTSRQQAEIGLYNSLNIPEMITEIVEARSPQPSPPPEPTLIPLPDLPVGFNVDNLAPDFTLPTLNGETITLSAGRGKPTLINFWASWCPPCRQELPALQAAYETYGDKINFIAVDVKEDQATVSGFAQQLGLTFPIVLDSSGSVSNLDYRVLGLPTTVFLDANGVIVQRHVGPLDETLIDSYLEPILPTEPTIIKETTYLPQSDISDETVSRTTDFSLLDSTGETVSLADYQGKSNIVLVFYRGHT
ncbi:redoxin domain-containing protein [Anaerolineales bacterium HSG24]|nr:redoxin domain-containing protein [Anaerolineales bacterium HSG24]